MKLKEIKKKIKATKVGVKQIRKPTPKWIRKTGTALVSIGSAGSALFIQLGMLKIGIICALGGLVGKAITIFFGDEKVVKTIKKKNKNKI